MFIVHASQLSGRELHQLGHNLAAVARQDRQTTLHAVNRSLAAHDEQVGDDDEIDAIVMSEHLAS